MVPPTRELTVCRCGVERFAVQRDKSTKEKYWWGTKEGVLDPGKPHEGAAWLLVWWVSRSQMNVEGKGIPGEGMWVWNCRLCFINHKEPGIAGALELWDLCWSGKSWSWTGWQREKKWSVSHICLTNSYCKRNYVLERQTLPIGWEMRWSMHLSFLFIPLLLASKQTEQQKCCFYKINCFKIGILPGQTSAEIV